MDINGYQWNSNRISNLGLSENCDHLYHLLYWGKWPLSSGWNMEFSPDFPDKPCFGMLMLGDGEHQDGSGWISLNFPHSDLLSDSLLKMVIYLQEITNLIMKITEMGPFVDDFPLLTIIPVTSQWGHYNSSRFMIVIATHCDHESFGLTRNRRTKPQKGNLTCILLLPYIQTNPDSIMANQPDTLQKKI
jgi:hypothetical protein